MYKTRHLAKPQNNCELSENSLFVLMASAALVDSGGGCEGGLAVGIQHRFNATSHLRAVHICV